MIPTYVTYIRVSTKSQGESRLGLEAQQKAIADYLATKPDGRIVSEYHEIESGADDDRPELAKALNDCKLYNATLVIAKLDRLSRSAAFLATLQESKTKFVCCDFPEADEFLVGVMALLARWERNKISERTKEALAARKARGEKWNGHRPAKGTGISPEMRTKAVTARRKNSLARAEHYRNLFAELDDQGFTSHSKKAEELKRRKVPNPSGTSHEWQAMQVSRIAKRLNENLKGSKLL